MVIRADAERSSSGLIYQQDIDLTEYPVIEWSLAYRKCPSKMAMLPQKSGDDYAARIYVIFDYELSNLPWGSAQHDTGIAHILSVRYRHVPLTTSMQLTLNPD